MITALHWVNIVLAHKLLHSIEDSRSLQETWLAASGGAQTRFCSWALCFKAMSHYRFVCFYKLKGSGNKLVVSLIAAAPTCYRVAVTCSETARLHVLFGENWTWVSPQFVEGEQKECERPGGCGEPLLRVIRSPGAELVVWIPGLAWMTKATRGKSWLFPNEAWILIRTQRGTADANCVST